ncbi:MAG: type II toxin-antitoxin system VapC family toxin [Rhodospirillales bacterium]|nr:type II toxin-antitoxin system VapC family toxin [Rhodospirillales bacterium]
MIVDTSALLAIAWNESEGSTFLDAIESSALRLISAASVLEAGIVVARRAGRETAGEAIAALGALIDQLGLDIEPVTAVQVQLALAAYGRYGKGIHPAGLNFGDLFAYALAKETDEPLLFKGLDFTQTDVTTAL